jgi:RNA polymerase sigma factor, sigma-70 family
MTDRAEDLVLLTRITNGEQEAMKLLYNRYSGAVYQFAKSWLGDPHEASDIMHETMLNVWRNAARFEQRSSVKSWIFSIARNKAIDRNRKAVRLTYTEIDTEIPDDTPNAQDIVNAMQDAVQVRECISKLSDAHRSAIHLAFFEDLPYGEIAKIEGCPVGTVKTRILHAKKLLMRCVMNNTAEKKQI